VFNITFICLYQHLLLLLIVLPSHAAQRSTAPLGALDAAASALFLSLVLLESIADQQQWRFQQSKRNLLPRQCVRIWRAKRVIWSCMFAHLTHCAPQAGAGC
jgi:steroid 5-alpha reductase family enzyme